ncbi:MAG: hypothetical protein K1X85_05970 [Ignavibacteria bacterium]|nr:hypothetical protein [Ignavibacteria bacterium]
MSGPFEFLPHYLRKKFSGKLLMIESDDWGLERGIDEQSIEWARRRYSVTDFTRWTLDALETEEDLDELYSVLEKHKDNEGNPPVVTANFITHNIDYGSRDELLFRPISDGFSEGGKLQEAYERGIARRLMFPQLHGYSHYDVTALRKYFTTDEARESFENKFLACCTTLRGRLSFLQGELSSSNGESTLIKDAADVFEKTFGFRSLTVIPPTFILDDAVLQSLADAGIRLIQSSNRLVDSKKNRYRYPYFRIRKGFIWSVRNARLDPYPGYDFGHEQCTESVGKAFENDQPAVIDFHRVNFSGRFDRGYRERSLRELDLLITNVLKKWPDVKFTHTQKFFEDHWQRRIN